ncbi:stress-responsive transcriptional activator [Saccharomycopsis crataegensis]|uniref:Stress-responsive transcriptional activator n=1 Tax=Saccharomycopsis crataegensis TaxID=43959 RepID=A0AAV5QJN8_9ASCO|nr:stress-responsive transcriptional activator [Saccharomycopsis crataegensis]
MTAAYNTNQDDFLSEVEHSIFALNYPQANPSSSASSSPSTTDNIATSLSSSIHHPSLPIHPGINNTYHIQNLNSPVASGFSPQAIYITPGTHHDFANMRQAVNAMPLSYIHNNNHQINASHNINGITFNDSSTHMVPVADFGSDPVNSNTSGFQNIQPHQLSVINQRSSSQTIMASSDISAYKKVGPAHTDAIPTLHDTSGYIDGSVIIDQESRSLPINTPRKMEITTDTTVSNSPNMSSTYKKLVPIHEYSEISVADLAASSSSLNSDVSSQSLENKNPDIHAMYKNHTSIFNGVIPISNPQKITMHNYLPGSLSREPSARFNISSSASSSSASLLLSNPSNSVRSSISSATNAVESSVLTNTKKHNRSSNSLASIDFRFNNLQIDTDNQDLSSGTAPLISNDCNINEAKTSHMDVNIDHNHDSEDFVMGSITINPKKLKDEKFQEDTENLESKKFDKQVRISSSLNADGNSLNGVFNDDSLVPSGNYKNIDNHKSMNVAKDSDNNSDNYCENKDDFISPTITNSMKDDGKIDFRMQGEAVTAIAQWLDQDSETDPETSLLLRRENAKLGSINHSGIHRTGSFLLESSLSSAHYNGLASGSSHRMKHKKAASDSGYFMSNFGVSIYTSGNPFELEGSSNPNVFGEFYDTFGNELENRLATNDEFLFDEDDEDKIRVDELENKMAKDIDSENDADDYDHNTSQLENMKEEILSYPSIKDTPKIVGSIPVESSSRLSRTSKSLKNLSKFESPTELSSKETKRKSLTKRRKRTKSESNILSLSDPVSPLSKITKSRPSTKSSVSSSSINSGSSSPTMAIISSSRFDITSLEAISIPSANLGKPFQCSQCEKSFKRQEHLKRHFRSVHSNERPFLCVYCDKKFSRSDNLSQHLRTHNRGK